MEYLSFVQLSGAKYQQRRR